MNSEDSRSVIIDYTNWKGIRSTRRVKPQSIYFGSTVQHPEVQWLMQAFDFEKDADRCFAMKDIHTWSVK